MNKENIRRRIRNVTAFAAALLLAASFSLPSGTEIMGERVGNAIVASAEEYNDFYYEVNSDGETVTITGYSGGDSIVTIPGEIDGKTVTAIGDWAFEDKSSLRTIKIPDSVTSIGDSAFKNCSNLMNINIPDSVTSIGDNAFGGCLNLNIIIPDGVTSIGKSAFNTCVSLVNVKLPENSQFKSIESSTFAGCINLKSITIPNSVESIGENAFERCESLESVTLPSNSSFTSIADYAFISCTSLTSITIPNSVTSIGQNAFESCTSLTSIFLPDGLDVTNASIPASATQIKYSVDDNSNVTITKVTPGKGVTSVTVPDTINGKTVTAVCIKDGTTGVVIPASATQIKYSVDENSNVTITKVTPGEGVTSVTVPDTIDGKKVTAVGDSAFHQCSELTIIVLPDGLNSIGEYAFGGCSGLTSIILPDGVTSIGRYAFSYCSSLESITIPKGVATIGYCTFDQCTALKSVTISDGVETIGERAFFCCESLESVNIPSSVTAIESAAFLDCTALKSISIPDGVKSIGDNAFDCCSSLKSIEISESVTSIGNKVFANCSSLERITVDENNPNYSSENGVLFNKGKTSLLIYPQNKSDASYEIPNGVDSIGDITFADCNNLKSITIPGSVGSIGFKAFFSCDNLTSINMADGVTSIGNMAFMYCSSLEIIYIPSSVTSVGSSAFNYCEKLETILYPHGVDVSAAKLPERTIQMAYAVDDNILITGVKIGSGEVSMTVPDAMGGKTIAVITNNAFAECSNLVKIILPQGVDTSAAGIPDTATQIRYSVGEDGNATITKVSLGSGDHDLTMPQNIGDRAVTGFADGALADCPKVSHTHREKTAATCTSQAVCAICETGYGETEAHNLNKHDAVPVSCTTDGNIEYYECNVCGKLFADENGEKETTLEAVMISAIGHSISHVYAKDPTCTEDGNNEHYKCSVCNMLFEDANGTTETTLDDVTIPAIGHNFGIACDSNAGGHYYVCTVCDEKSDIEEHIKDNGTVIKEATPTENGTITYKCIVCGAKAGEETITATISSFEVTASNVIVYYTVTGSTEEKSQKYDFDEVTEEWIDIMKSKNIKLVIDFVNYSTAGSDIIMLTSAQMKAIEYVLAHDYGIAS